MRSEGERRIKASGEEAMKGLQAWWCETVRVWGRERERERGRGTLSSASSVLCHVGCCVDWAWSLGSVLDLLVKQRKLDF